MEIKKYLSLGISFALLTHCGQATSGSVKSAATGAVASVSIDHLSQSLRSNLANIDDSMFDVDKIDSFTRNVQSLDINSTVIGDVSLSDLGVSRQQALTDIKTALQSANRQELLNEARKLAGLSEKELAARIKDALSQARSSQVGHAASFGLATAGATCASSTGALAGSAFSVAASAVGFATCGLTLGLGCIMGAAGLASGVYGAVKRGGDASQLCHNPGDAAASKGAKTAAVSRGFR